MKQIIDIELEIEAYEVKDSSVNGTVNTRETVSEILTGMEILLRPTELKREGNKFKLRLRKAENIITSAYYTENDKIFELVVKGGKVINKIKD